MQYVHVVDSTKKSQRRSWSYLDPINYETDSDHGLDTKKNLDFPVYLLLSAMAEVCTVPML